MAIKPSDCVLKLTVATEDPFSFNWIKCWENFVNAMYASLKINPEVVSRYSGNPYGREGMQTLLKKYNATYKRLKSGEEVLVFKKASMMTYFMLEWS